LRDVEQVRPIDKPLLELLAEEHGPDQIAGVLERMRADMTFDAMGPFLESGASFRARVITAVEAIIQRHPSRRVVIVTHAPVIMVALSHALRSPFDLSFNPRLTSITRFLARDGRLFLDFANATPHFEPGPDA
jgi:broad specificity phosphatase PhoE